MRMKYLAPDIVASLLPACSHWKLHLVVLIQGRDKAYWYNVQHLLISFLTKDSVSKYRLSMELHLSGERWDTFRWGFASKVANTIMQLARMVGLPAFFFDLSLDHYSFFWYIYALIWHFGMFGAPWHHRQHSCGFPYYERRRFPRWRNLWVQRDRCEYSYVYVLNFPY